MILGDHRKREKPHWADFVLAMAFESLEAEKCGKCGVPAWYAFSEDSRIAFELAEHECHSCAHKERAEEKMKDKEKNKPGVTRYVKPVPEEGFEELPTRADFQESMLAKALKEQTKKPVVQ